jgi:Mrp family chromosome partitioning ATPase
VDQMLTFGDYFAVVRRRFVWILGAIVACVLLGLAYSEYETPTYEARSTVVLANVAPPAFMGGGTSSSATIERLVATQATIGSSGEVATRTVNSPQFADTGISSQQFLEMSSVSPDPKANTLHFTVQADRRELAVRLANVFAKQYVDYQAQLVGENAQPTIDSLEGTIDDLKGIPGPTLATAKANLANLKAYVIAQQSQTTAANPATNASQVQPDTRRNVLLALALGTALGLALAFIVHAADNRVYSVRRFAAASALPVIGKLPSLGWRHRRRPITDAGTRIHEQARVAAARLGFARNAGHAKTLLVTSADPVAGSSDVATWLAWGQAEIGNRVTLIDLDFTHGKGGEELLSIPAGRPGASDVVANRTELDQAAMELHTSGGGVLTVIGPGPPPSDEMSVATSPAFHLLLERAREDADLVLLNAPAVTDSSFTVVLTEFADALVVVARLPRTREVDIGRLRDALAGTPTPTLGAIVVGGEDYPDAGSAPPMARTGRNRPEGARSGLGDWSGDVVSRS